MMGKSQREKGAAAEREVANLLKDYGFASRRGQVFNGEPDVVTDLPFHVEVKRHEKISLPEWIRQASEAAKKRDKRWIVVHRRSREDWLVTMKFTDFLDVMDVYMKGE